MSKLWTLFHLWLILDWRSYQAKGSHFIPVTFLHWRVHKVNSNIHSSIVKLFCVFGNSANFTYYYMYSQNLLHYINYVEH